LEKTWGEKKVGFFGIIKKGQKKGETSHMKVNPADRKISCKKGDALSGR